LQLTNYRAEGGGTLEPFDRRQSLSPKHIGRDRAIGLERGQKWVPRASPAGLLCWGLLHLPGPRRALFFWSFLGVGGCGGLEGWWGCQLCVERGSTLTGWLIWEEGGFELAASALETEGQGRGTQGPRQAL